jgi:hypothetical protein
VLQVLDPAEIDFPFQHVTKFEGLESLPELLVDPRALKQAYQREFDAFRKELQVGCRSIDIDYQLVRTDEPMERFLTRFLSERAKRPSLA